MRAAMRSRGRAKGRPMPMGRPMPSYEEVLLIIIVIPENIRFFQPNLDVSRQCGCQKPYARFLASFYMYLGSGKNPKIKNVKFLTNGASECRNITQNRQITYST